MTQLTVSGITKAYGGRRVLGGVDLEVPENSLTAILGPSGSGKTTLLRVIAGFERADSGTVRLGDRVVDGSAGYVPPERRRIGYVPQEGSLFPHLSVAANIAFGIPGRERRKAVAGLLDAVGMAGLGHRYPHQLSGGQQQRVALARALAVKPAIVLLDEPFGSLDAGLRAAIRADVRRLLRAAGATAILVTHDQDEALSTADQVAVLRDGMIVQSAAPDELYNRPADPEVAQFIGEANLIDGILADGSVDTVLGPLQVRADARCGLDSGPVTVLVRPEQINIHMVQQSREPFLLLGFCSLPYTPKSRRHAYPARRPAHAVLVRVPLGPLPSLHRLRIRSFGLVRRLRRYCRGV